MRSSNEGTPAWQASWPVGPHDFISYTFGADVLCSHELGTLLCVCRSWRALFLTVAPKIDEIRVVCGTSSELECAISVGSVSRVELLRSHSNFDPRRCDRATRLAAEGGHVKMLRHLRSLGASWAPELCEIAAGRGDLEVLRFLHESGCPWEPKTIDVAVESGSQECTRYAVENGCCMCGDQDLVVSVVQGLSSENEEQQLAGLERAKRAMDRQYLRDALLWSGSFKRAFALLGGAQTSFRVRTVVLRTMDALLRPENGPDCNTAGLVISQGAFEALAHVITQDKDFSDVQEQAVEILHRLVGMCPSRDRKLGVMLGIVPALLSHLQRSPSDVLALEVLWNVILEVNESTVSKVMEKSLPVLLRVLVAHPPAQQKYTNLAACVIFRVLSVTDSSLSVESARTLFTKPYGNKVRKHCHPAADVILDAFSDDPVVSTSPLATYLRSVRQETHISLFF